MSIMRVEDHLLYVVDFYAKQPLMFGDKKKLNVNEAGGQLTQALATLLHEGGYRDTDGNHIKVKNTQAKQYLNDLYSDLYPDQGSILSGGKQENEDKERDAFGNFGKKLGVEGVQKSLRKSIPRVNLYKIGKLKRGLGLYVSI